jgi:hypothetical protein
MIIENPGPFEHKYPDESGLRADRFKVGNPAPTWTDFERARWLREMIRRITTEMAQEPHGPSRAAGMVALRSAECELARMGLQSDVI